MQPRLNLFTAAPETIKAAQAALTRPGGRLRLVAP